MNHTGLVKLVLSYSRTVFHAPKIFTIGVLACVLLGLIGMGRFHFDASLDSLLLENDPDLWELRATEQRYGKQQAIFVAFTPHNGLFQKNSLDELLRLQQTLEQIPEVISSYSMLRAPLLWLSKDVLNDVDTFPTIYTITEDLYPQARQELSSSPLYSDFLVNQDGDTATVILSLDIQDEYARLTQEKQDLLIRFYQEDGFSQEHAKQLKKITAEHTLAKRHYFKNLKRTIKQIRKVTTEFEPHGALHIGGTAVINNDMVEYVVKDLMVFGLGALFCMIVVLFFLFRNIIWVSLPILSCLFSVVCMLGVFGALGWEVTVVSSNCITLMLIFTMSMNIHLIFRYREICRTHPYKEGDYAEITERVSMATSSVFIPSLYSVLTTMIGFTSLMVSSIKPVISFGWMMVLALLFSLFGSFTIFPVFLSWFGKYVTAHGEKPSGRIPFWALRFTQGCANLVSERRGFIYIVFFVLLCFLWMGIGKLYVENSAVNFFDHESRIYQDLSFIDQKFGGTTPLDIMLRFKPDTELAMQETDKELATLFEEDASDPKQDNWFTLGKIESIKNVHDYLSGLPAAGKVFSYASMLKTLEIIIDRIPGSFEAELLAKRLPKETKDLLFSPYISIEHNEARINVRIRDTYPGLNRKAFIQSIEETLSEKFNLEPDAFKISGITVLYSNMLQSLYRSQILSLGIVILLVFFVFCVIFRSVKVALVGILPNIFVAVGVIGLVGWLKIPLDLMNITIAAITIGIGVDDSIHYLYRFREEYYARGDYIATMRYSHRHIGRTALFTTITVCIGFSILFFSEFTPTKNFGLLTAISMGSALLATLLLMASLMITYKPFKELD